MELYFAMLRRVLLIFTGRIVRALSPNSVLTGDRREIWRVWIYRIERNGGGG